MKDSEATLKRSHKGNTQLLYIPANMVLDSAYPLKEGKVRVRVEGNRLIVENI